ncbi:MAG: class I SAM-dependent methyltransferase family protein [Candidatus Micrarchaeia archaeon]
MLFLKVPKKDGESVRRKLIEAGILDKQYDIINSGNFVMLPTSKAWGGFDTVELHVKKRPERFDRLEDALSKLLTKGEMETLVKSFDIVGDIAICEIPAPLEGREAQIGAALLKVHRNLRTVLKKLGPMEGEHRVRRFKCIAGEDRTETFYRESGVIMKLDLARVYFSVRLATERSRIADLCGEHEKVLVLFAGVGPFALLIAKARPGSDVVAVEMNHDAVAYMDQNISLNHLDNVRAVEGDARAVDYGRYSGGGGFDRVVMPLPKSAHEFLDIAFSAVKPGGIVHFYTLSDISRPFEDAFGKALPAAERGGFRISVENQRVVRPYSPGLVQVVLDLRVVRTSTASA